jgi:hypothetical protein
VILNQHPHTTRTGVARRMFALADRLAHARHAVVVSWASMEDRAAGTPHCALTRRPDESMPYVRNIVSRLSVNVTSPIRTWTTFAVT